MIRRIFFWLWPPPVQAGKFLGVDRPGLNRWPMGWETTDDASKYPELAKRVWFTFLWWDFDFERLS